MIPHNSPSFSGGLAPCSLIDEGVRRESPPNEAQEKHHGH